MGVVTLFTCVPARHISKKDNPALVCSGAQVRKEEKLGPSDFASACLEAVETRSLLHMSKFVVNSSSQFDSSDFDPLSRLACLQAVTSCFCEGLVHIFIRGQSEVLGSMTAPLNWGYVTAAHSFLAGCASLLDDPQVANLLSTCHASLASALLQPAEEEADKFLVMLASIYPSSLLSALQLAGYSSEDTIEDTTAPLGATASPQAAVAFLFLLDLFATSPSGSGCAREHWTTALQSVVPHDQHSLTNSQRLKILQHVFTTVFALAQEHSITDKLVESPSLARETFLFLARWRFPLAEDTAFDSCLVATLEAACLVLEETGLACASEGPLAAVLSVLSQPEAANICFTMLSAGMLRFKGAPAQSKGPKLQPARVLLALYKQDPSQAMLLCAQLLGPESQQDVQSRLAAIKAMEEVVVGAAGEGERMQDVLEDKPPLATALWSHGPLHLLIYTLKCDPAVRVRRAALALLTRVEVPNGTPLQEAVVGAVLLKCRDRDAPTQRQAISMLLQFPPALLHAVLPPNDLVLLVHCWLTADSRKAAGSKDGGQAYFVEQAAALISLALNGPYEEGENKLQRLVALQPFRREAECPEAYALLKQKVLAAFAEVLQAALLAER